jgi:CMP/dCMP kinase
MKNPRVAIDGPAGAGKSTVARRLAERLGFVLVDTGALYRTVALIARREGLSWDDEPAVTRVAERLNVGHQILPERGEVGATGGSGVRVFVGGEDVSLAIREPEMGMGASRVSAIPGVRAALLDAQRSAGERGGVVLEGRDIGTVVFPDAEVKFFLTASPAVRAQRRFEELSARGAQVTLEETLTDVIERDKADTERPIAPLKQASDAILVDSSTSDVDEIVEAMAKTVEARARA